MMSPDIGTEMNATIGTAGRLTVRWAALLVTSTSPSSDAPSSLRSPLRTPATLEPEREADLKVPLAATWMWNDLICDSATAAMIEFGSFGLTVATALPPLLVLLPLKAAAVTRTRPASTAPAVLDRRVKVASSVGH